ncbi:P-loop containing nucleoside triphosphate hydrolase protein [Anaeromyces robustus]|uniref:p-loop containing nucleoside triphosphate hydrolase protein n=1 Tax=Anaeromyces robustus TaxID=1754192 RepID=A0A1Y1W5T9_9FUNG|nr:P-loop containing nucleoside triphosphate hydrolase protein [Anaeromyces robustus]|eukprot:ORX68901.1 P-loop containing nucleoside triphosphate hydrolase protein [Anaeromyces robustus]
MKDDKLKYEIKERHNIIHVPNGDFIYNYVTEHQNSTRFGLVFDIKKDQGTTNYRYQVLYNSTANFNGTDSYSTHIVSIARGIDEAIVKFANGDPNIKAEFDLDLKDFPKLGFEGYQDYIASANGPSVFFVVSMVIFINMLSNIVSEKETKVRYSMEMMGLKRSVYWTSWAIVYFIFFFINAFSTVIFGKLFGYTFFTKTDFMVLLLLFFLFGLAMGSMAIFITTLVNKVKLSVLIGISILIIGFMFNSIFGNDILCYLFWSDSISQNWRKAFSYLIPFFNFSKAFVDIKNKASSTYNVATTMISEGEGYTWEDLSSKPETAYSNFEDTNLDYMEPTSYTFYYLLFNIFLYFILALYFDNIIPNIYGNRKPFYYFLLPSYWKNKNIYINERSWVKNILNKYPSKINIKNLDDDVQEHYKYTCEKSNKDPVKIVNLRKIYGAGKSRKIAVRNTCLSMGKGKVLALLGQNGAGKSTTMNIISGLSPPTGGDILVYNKSVRKYPEAVQSELGICPQEDILFKDLTAIEHLRLYSGLKGAEDSVELEELLINRLKSVQLYTVRNARSKTYSGGMKRRLSMIIATIGDPRVILLDEPTTGMDPVNRRYVWRFVEEFKKDRCILLTTHSMEEADALGDDICIMSRGFVKAIGNSIHLKNKFGNGYRISVLVDSENMENLKAVASQMVPGIHLADDSAGALIYDLSYQQANYIPKFVKYLDENPDHYVNSWGMSQTTLEEVFLNVIHEDSKRKFKDKKEELKKEE